jgi:hypothetical protein
MIFIGEIAGFTPRFLEIDDSLMTNAQVYEVRPRIDHRGVDLISDALPFGRLWYGEPNAISNAISHAKSFGCSHDAVIRVYDDACKLIEVHRHKGDFKNYDRL